MKLIEVFSVILNTETTLNQKVGSFIGVAGGASFSIYNEVYVWFKTIMFMVIGTFLTFIMPKIWQFLYDKLKHKSNGRKRKK